MHYTPETVLKVSDMKPLSEKFNIDFNDDSNSLHLTKFIKD